MFTRVNLALIGRNEFCFFVDVGKCPKKKFGSDETSFRIGLFASRVVSKGRNRIRLECVADARRRDLFNGTRFPESALQESPGVVSVNTSPGAAVPFKIIYRIITLLLSRRVSKYLPRPPCHHPPPPPPRAKQCGIRGTHAPGVRSYTCLYGRNRAGKINIIVYDNNNNIRVFTPKSR